MSNKAIAEKFFQSITAGNISGALACFAPGAEFTAPTGALPYPDGIRAML